MALIPSFSAASATLKRGKHHNEGRSENGVVVVFGVGSTVPGCMAADAVADDTLSLFTLKLKQNGGLHKQSPCISHRSKVVGDAQALTSVSSNIRLYTPRRLFENPGWVSSRFA